SLSLLLFVVESFEFRGGGTTLFRQLLAIRELDINLSKGGGSPYLRRSPLAGHDYSGMGASTTGQLACEEVLEERLIE
ncbi:MAG: hypothetical protein QXG25_06640, partial [Nitrososphaerota archaeon]